MLLDRGAFSSGTEVSVRSAEGDEKLSGDADMEDGDMVVVPEDQVVEIEVRRQKAKDNKGKARAVDAK